MAKIIIFRNADQEASIKIISETSEPETVTLSLADLCKKPNGREFQVAYPEEAKRPFRVSFRALQWSGEFGGVCRINRGGERVMSIQSAPQGLMQFEGQQFCSDSHNAEDDIIFSFIDAPMEIWAVLRKENYLSIGDEIATYGAYEDENRLGARTDIDGSPDFKE